MNQSSLLYLYYIEKRIKFSIYILTFPSLPNNFPSHSSKEKKKSSSKVTTNNNPLSLPHVTAAANYQRVWETWTIFPGLFARNVTKRERTRRRWKEGEEERERETYNSIAAGVNNEPEPDSYGIGGVTSLCSLSRIIRPARVSRIISRVLPK